MLQHLIVALLVVGCTAYAAWTLMPSTWRRSLAGALAQLPLPRTVATRLKAASSQTASGCGCDGCDRAPNNKNKAPASTRAPNEPGSAAPQPITFHRRIRN